MIVYLVGMPGAGKSDGRTGARRAPRRAVRRPRRGDRAASRASRSRRSSRDEGEAAFRALRGRRAREGRARRTPRWSPAAAASCWSPRTGSRCATRARACYLDVPLEELARARPAGRGPAPDPRGGRSRAAARPSAGRCTGSSPPTSWTAAANPARWPTRSSRSSVGPRDRPDPGAVLRRRGRARAARRRGASYLPEFPERRARVRRSRTAGGGRRCVRRRSRPALAERGLDVRAADACRRARRRRRCRSTRRSCTSWRPRRHTATTSSSRSGADRWATWRGSSPPRTCGACRSCRCRRRCSAQVDAAIGGKTAREPPRGQEPRRHLLPAPSRCWPTSKRSRRSTSATFGRGSPRWRSTRSRSTSSCSTMLEARSRPGARRAIPRPWNRSWPGAWRRRPARSRGRARRGAPPVPELRSHARARARAPRGVRGTHARRGDRDRDGLRGAPRGAREALPRPGSSARTARLLSSLGLETDGPPPRGRRGHWRRSAWTRSSTAGVRFVLLRGRSAARWSSTTWPTTSCGRRCCEMGATA